MLVERKLLQKDNFSYFLLKKTERLTSALYLVTDLIPVTEPLRQTMRTCGLNIMSFIAEERGGDIETHKKERDDVMQNYTAELLAFLSVGEVSRYISEMNRGILDREYKELLRLFNENRGKVFFSHEQTLQPEFFNVTEEFLDSVKEENKDHSELWGGGPWKQRNKRHYKGQQLSTKKTIIKDRNVLLESSKRDNDGQKSRATKGDRRNTILRFVKEKGRVSVKDISDVIFNCSEKTLQRELLALVSEGVLKKEGERRWSTYVFVGTK